MHEFVAWPKTTRLFRDIIVTEKIDGTNAAIHISELTAGWEDYPLEAHSLVVDGTRYVITAQSRKRLIWPGQASDNFGFAAWVYENARELVRLLGTGLHYGEWWGQGIQRGYGLEERRFSLFNVDRYAHTCAFVGPVWVDPVVTLYRGPNDTDAIKESLQTLSSYGSVAAYGWPTPEGVCIYHSASRTVSKVTLDNQDAGKWEA
jgi:hypothetical protein